MPVPFDDYKSEQPVFDPDSNAFRIVEFLAQNPDLGFTPKEIHEETGITRGSIGTTLNRLEDRDLVRHKEPYWSINEAEVDKIETLLASLETVEESTYYDWGEADPADYRIGIESVSESPSNHD